MAEYCNLSWQGMIHRDEFHNLTLYCEDFIFSMDLATFLIQLVRCSLLLSLMAVLLAVYNSISIMNRHILSTSTCSIYWILMLLMLAFKSCIMVIFPALVAKFASESSHFNMAGYILQALFQSASVFLLFVALDHERRFRSSEFATVDKPSKHCIALSCGRRMFFSWPRVVALVLTLVPILVWIIIEVMFGYRKDDTAYSPLVWVYLLTLPLTRLACLVMGGVLVLKRKGKLAPSIPTKILLVIALLLSLMEDFPNFATGCLTGLDCDAHLKYLTIYDLFQLIGAGSFIFFVLFIRGQYLRVEQESKLNLMMELQKLLQVNGRKDIIRHYT